MRRKRLTVKQSMTIVLSEGKFLTLHEIRQRLLVAYQVIASECSISARWCEINGCHKQSRVRAKARAWEYRVVA